MKLTSRSARQEAPKPFAQLGPRPHLAGHTLLETAPLTLPDGREWVATLWKTPIRANGRRIQVRDELGRGLFDTEDCFDLANATNSVSVWLDGQVKAAPSRIAGIVEATELSAP